MGLGSDISGRVLKYEVQKISGGLLRKREA